MCTHFCDYCNNRAEEEKGDTEKNKSYLLVAINLCQPHWSGIVDVTTDLKDSRLVNLFPPRIGSECTLQKERRKTFSMHGRWTILIFLENQRSGTISSWP